MSNVLHYKGDCTDYDPKQLYGPDMWGAYYKATGAEFDAEFRWSDGTLGRTTLQMLPVPPDELRRRLFMGKVMQQIIANKGYMK